MSHQVDDCLDLNHKFVMYDVHILFLSFVPNVVDILCVRKYTDLFVLEINVLG